MAAPPVRLEDVLLRTRSPWRRARRVLLRAAALLLAAALGAAADHVATRETPATPPARQVEDDLKNVVAANSRLWPNDGPRKLAGYLGLDPRVIQSGSAPATHGQISKQGSVSARHALVEASWSAVRQPGPLHAFYGRVRARRGHSVAIVATARKLGRRRQPRRWKVRFLRRSAVRGLHAVARDEKSAAGNDWVRDRRRLGAWLPEGV